MSARSKKAVRFALVLGAVASIGSWVVAADEQARNVHTGRASVYRQLDPDSLEHLSSAQTIKAVTMGNVAPTRIWKVLEHGERVECLDCIVHVEKLLWDANSKTREISAWWLRRRIFGVFGPGQVYEQVLKTLQESQDEHQRAYAAEAIGEFLVASGVEHVARAAVKDPSAKVRLSSVRALTRLNHEGPASELAAALSDPNEEVRLAALTGAMRVHVFSKVDQIVARIDDPSAPVRRKAARALGAMRAGDAVLGLVLLSSPENEADASVRAAAVAALGRIADSGARAAVRAALQDTDQYVRDAARISLRQL
jgi:HEAT repeat protein